MRRKLRIAIFTSGRFHVCDLARELSAIGHDVQFYSYVRPKRTARFGLPRECNRSLFAKVVHRLIAYRIFRSSNHRHWAERKLIETLDKVGSEVLEPCDVFIGMSGMSTRTAETARKKYGAKIWIERGSRHIISQKEILDAIPGADKVPQFAIQRELADYDKADYISVLSKHCEESFLEQKYPLSKLVRNPLGVNLQMFAPTNAPSFEHPTIVNAGAWSLRKGCDILISAWRLLKGVKLIHVGPVKDCPLPNDNGFEHYDAVDQTRLREFYAKSHVFALASREEGLATVQPQALACGLRLVCSSLTGGEDLQAFTSKINAVRVVLKHDPKLLSESLQAALDDARADSGSRDLLGAGREELSWKAYGRRYDINLQERM